MEWEMSDRDWEAWMADKPVLGRLHEERVFSLGLLKDGSLGIQEQCDEYFSVEMSHDNLSALIRELEMVRADMMAQERKDT